MPIYEYACKSCDHRLDALQKISDMPLVDCPECGEAALKRLLSAPRFRLKGQGWYETDFKKDNQRNLSSGDDRNLSSGDDTQSKPKDKAGDGGKSDSKSETKTSGKEKTDTKASSPSKT